MKINELPKKGISFLREVRIELKRVTWLTRKDTIKYTIFVIGLSLVVAAFLGGLDFLFSWLLDKFVI
ncbi:MAG: preprotein translocase subunit SecE [Patescibacteria group bacterium]|nr:preprotein translocase subunit SecE [Patescibacteria group bacterium]